MSISVKDGIARIGFTMPVTLCGLTGGATLPPLGTEYESFSLEAENGDQGLFSVVTADRIYLCQYYYDKDKLKIDLNTEKVGKRAYSLSTDMGVLVQVGDLLYVTGSPLNKTSLTADSVYDLDALGLKIKKLTRTCMLVDHTTMLKYIEGTATPEDLASNACLVKCVSDKLSQLDGALAELANAYIELGELRVLASEFTVVIPHLRSEIERLKQSK